MGREEAFATQGAFARILVAAAFPPLETLDVIGVEVLVVAEEHHDLAVCAPNGSVANTAHHSLQKTQTQPSQ
jgi:hypothetical protein